MLTEEDIGRKCIKKWGLNEQIRQTIEECAELIVELAKFNREVNSSSEDSICEEIADVEIMINQMKLAFSDSKINYYKLKKLKELEKRIGGDGI